MSIVLVGSTSGSCTLQEQAVAGNTVLTLPTTSGTLLTTATPFSNGQGPAFSAWQSSAQNLASSTVTKLQFQTEEWDTANCFDNTTNYRFTPNVAGYYQVNGSLRANTSFNTMQVALYKNGSNYKEGNYVQTNMGQSTVSCLVYLNGTTDFIELYGFFSTGQNCSNQSSQTYFQAALVRGA